MASKKSKHVVKEEPMEEDLNATTDTANGDAKPKTDKDAYNEQLNYVSIIANPMASRKLTRKIYKFLKKASKQKNYVRNGLKDVQRRIRKGEKGIVIFAGDVTPVDIMCHMPAVCEEKGIPYIYTPSRQELGHALGLKRTSLMVLVRQHDDYKDLYDEVAEEIKAVPFPL